MVIAKACPFSGSSPGVDPYVAGYLEVLRCSGYSERSLRKKLRVFVGFVEWMGRRKGSVTDMSPPQVSAFLRRRGVRGSKDRTARERVALYGLLRHVGGASRVVPEVLQNPKDARLASLEASYTDYLRNGRGLAERSIEVYLPYVRSFLGAWLARAAMNPGGVLDAPFVRSFLLGRIRGRSVEWAKLQATSLRSVLRFLFLRGEAALDLSLAVPTVRRWSLSPVPAFLSPEEVERVLAAPDRTSSRGRRDYAILLLLARLGLRAGEVVALELGDIYWRTGEILVRGKGGALDRLPLLSDVGEAMALYLEKDRSRSSSRRVFLRMLAPHVGFSGSSAVGHVVRLALCRSGQRSPSSRGAAHLFRHSLATRMIRQGATLAQISEVLRHRCPGTTQTYAKVDFETLRDVARDWPGTGKGSGR